MLKRIINLAVSALLRILDLVQERAGRILRRRASRTCVVLAYHSVTREERSLFAKQMDVLLRRAKPLRADVLMLPEEGGCYAAITFDDGLECIIENALPELRKRNIPSTLFIVTDVLGQYPKWEYFGGDDPTRQKAMSKEQLIALPSDLVTVGSHSMTHPLLPSISEDKLRAEVAGSRAKLEEFVKREVKLLSFPYGAFDERVTAQCRQASYSRVFSALPVLAFSEPGEFVTGRVGVTPRDWAIEFRLKLAGAYRWLPYAYSLKRSILSLVAKGDRLHRSQGEERKLA
jgi:peptidoglycan/xylan/chitin deacetylase (PgdA/CDA1 family)